jgi:hypothetical protein
MKKYVLAGLVMLLNPVLLHLHAQQIPDKSFDPPVNDPAYSRNKGPVVLVDEAHHNFHTVEGRYYVFAKTLQKDGYQVKSGNEPFTGSLLKDVNILVIANALNAVNDNSNDGVNHWTLPTPSAFTTGEIQAVTEWVKAGGSLLLIADHMPFPGAAFDLANAFGFTLYNGYATDTTSSRFPRQVSGTIAFSKEQHSLSVHPVTSGRNRKEQVDEVLTFTGEAFQIPGQAVSLLMLDDRYQVLLPDTAWVFEEDVKRIPAGGLSQGAVLDYGKGRVAVSGEAAMFSGQLVGQQQRPMGLNAPEAKQNIQFLLNLIHWLDHKL